MSLPLFLMTHIGALTTLFDEAGCPVKFITAVIGETNSRKTSLSLCLTKTLNRKEIQIPEITFASTEGGIEKAIALHPDAVLVIDDYMPASTLTKQRILDSKLEKVQRIYGDRKGIERMTDFAKNPSAGYYPVRGVGIITGEHIKGVQSSLTRSLILRINRGSVDNEKLGWYQKSYKILNNHVYDFLMHVTEIYEDTISFIKRKVYEYRAQDLFKKPRYNEMYAILMATVEIICDYARTRGFWNQETCRIVCESWKYILQDVIRQNEWELEQKDEGAFLLQVCETIAEDGFLPLPEKEEDNYGNKVFGDEEFIYIRLDSFLQKARSCFSLWGVECPNFTKQSVLTELEKADLIETKGKKEGKRSLYLPGSKKNKQRFIYIKQSKLKESIKKCEER